MIVQIIFILTILVLNTVKLHAFDSKETESTDDVYLKVISANSNIPECINTTIQDIYYENTTDAALRLKIGYGTAPITKYWVSSTNTTITYCAKPSPQLKYCNLTRIENYELVNHSLHAGNLTTQFGDYYINEDGIAITCSSLIGASQATPRCNRVKLTQDQFAILKNDSFYLKVANTIIERADYVTDEHNVTRLCYPLSIKFLNCRQEKQLAVLHLLLELDLQLNLRYKLQNAIYNPGDYYLMNDYGDAVICQTEFYVVLASQLGKAYCILYYVSTVLVILTMICQILTSELTCYVRCQLCHFVSLATFLICCTLFRDKEGATELAYAALVLYVHYFARYYTGMATVFWLNVLAFHIYQSFAHLDMLKSLDNVTTITKRFIYYNMYAFGMPAILVGCLLTLDLSPTLQSELSLYPNISVFYTFHDMSTAIVFYGCPLLILMGMNTVFFTLTIYHIRTVSKETEHMKLTRRNQSHAVWIKLFIIMGITMTAQGIMWSIRDRINIECWYVANAFVSVQGFAAFCIIVCRREMYELLKDKIVARLCK